jgi:hypothetical protein
VVQAKKLQMRKGMRVMITRDNLHSAGMTKAQAKPIPEKASRG